MSNAYSIDLRERVVAYVRAGGEKKLACHIFQIGRDTLYRWLRQYRIQGNVAPRPRGKYAPRKLDDVVVGQYIAEHSDATLAEVGEVVAVSGVAIWKACQRLQITRKKNAPVRRTKRARSRTISR